MGLVDPAHKYLPLSESRKVQNTYKETRKSDLGNPSEVSNELL